MLRHLGDLPKKCGNLLIVAVSKTVWDYFFSSLIGFVFRSKSVTARLAILRDNRHLEHPGFRTESLVTWPSVIRVVRTERKTGKKGVTTTNVIVRLTCKGRNSFYIQKSKSKMADSQTKGLGISRASEISFGFFSTV